MEELICDKCHKLFGYGSGDLNCCAWECLDCIDLVEEKRKQDEYERLSKERDEKFRREHPEWYPEMTFCDWKQAK